jgi:hypothetical protein
LRTARTAVPCQCLRRFSAPRGGGVVGLLGPVGKQTQSASLTHTPPVGGVFSPGKYLQTGPGGAGRVKTPSLAFNASGPGIDWRAIQCGLRSSPLILGDFEKRIGSRGKGVGSLLRRVVEAGFDKPSSSPLFKTDPVDDCAGRDRGAAAELSSGGSRSRGKSGNQRGNGLPGGGWQVSHGSGQRIDSRSRGQFR